MPLLVRWTYDTVTEESAAEGDYADCGWYRLGYGPISGREDDAVASAPEPDSYGSAAEFLRDIEGEGGCESTQLEHDGLRVYCHRQTDYRTGEDTGVTAHVKCPSWIAKVLVAHLR